ncbi:mevalonate kinase [Carnimonas nigrificans]|uniref:mevalonate kinase n=1 Tax=Carnimonas nigrificans TaxID=64323 RepID=UPI000A0383BE|nr:mevalonate kinase [Carnimonas nigrificans]
MMEREQQPDSFRSGNGTSCGKFILIGEHSVVFGHPAIAIPLLGVTMHAQVHREAVEPWFSSEVYDGPLAALPDQLAGIQGALAATLEALGESTEGLSITLESDVPVERGMGSSAASAGAIIRALFDYHRREASADQLFELVQVAERIAHGSPSGLDAVATSARAPVHFHQGTFADLDITLSGAVVIADTGIRGGTRHTVAALRARHAATPTEVEPDLERLAALTNDASRCLRDNNLIELGTIFDQAHAALSRLGVSSHELDHLVTSARRHGAVGAKMTGGGAGGCMLALCDSVDSAQRVAKGLRSDGAERTWIHTFDAHNNSALPPYNDGEVLS